MTDPLITQAQAIIQAAIDDPTVPPTVVAWQAANAIVEAGWRPPPGGDVVQQATDVMAHDWRHHAEAGTTGSPEDHCNSLAEALVDAGLLCDTPKRYVHPWALDRLAKQLRALDTDVPIGCSWLSDQERDEYTSRVEGSFGASGSDG